MKHLHFFFLLAFSLCILSCSNDDTNDASEATALYISKQTTISPFGVVEVEITYNEQKLPSSVEIALVSETIYYEFFYNSEGKIISMLQSLNDQLSGAFSYDYNALGQLSSVSSAGEEVPISVNGNTYTISVDADNVLTYTFDDAHNLIAKTSVRSDGSDAITEILNFIPTTDKGAFSSIKERMLPLYFILFDNQVEALSFDTLVCSEIDTVYESSGFTQNIQLQLQALEKNEEGLPTYVEKNYYDLDTNQSLGTLTTFNTYISL